jgi:hypothetical protein
MALVQSDVEVGRMALAILGTRSNIESFTEDSIEAKKLGVFRDQTRREVLYSFDWSFARRVKKLALHPTPPDDQWGFRYALPFDFVAVRRLYSPIGRQADLPAHSLSATETTVTLQTDIEQAELVYTQDVSSTLNMSPLFISAWAHLWAYYVSSDLLGEAGKQYAQVLLQRYQFILMQAMQGDANSDRMEPERDAPWIRDR